MEDRKDQVKLDAIPESIRQTLQDFVRDIQAALTDQLASVTVVGSCLSPEFRPGLSDINTVLVLNKQGQEQLKALAALAKSMHKQRMAPPLLMTADYIERSRDVFGVELLDFQLSGQTILGEDPFAGLTFAKADVRQQCERELKAMLVRLRQGYMAAAGKLRLVQDVLISTAKTLLPYLRAVLWLQQGTRRPGVQATLEEAEKALSVDVSPLQEVLKWRMEKTRLRDSDIDQAYDGLYSLVDVLALKIDGLEVD